MSNLSMYRVDLNDNDIDRWHKDVRFSCYIRTLALFWDKIDGFPRKTVVPEDPIVILRSRCDIEKYRKDGINMC